MGALDKEVRICRPILGFCVGISHDSLHKGFLHSLFKKIHTLLFPQPHTLSDPRAWCCCLMNLIHGDIGPQSISLPVIYIHVMWTAWM